MTADMVERADIAHEIFDLATMLGVLLAGPDAETALEGAHRVVLDIRAKAAVLKAANGGHTDIARKALHQDRQGLRSARGADCRRLIG